MSLNERHFHPRESLLRLSDALAAVSQADTSSRSGPSSPLPIPSDSTSAMV